MPPRRSPFRCIRPTWPRGPAASGKDEAWHVLEAVPDAAVWAGFPAPVTPARLRAAAADGSVLALLRRLTVRAGDTVRVAAGTVHAIGAGLVLLEVQDPVHVTCRLYDRGRPRPLQAEEALAVADLAAAYGRGRATDPAPASPGGRVPARAPRFAAERHDVGSGPIVHPDGARYHILVPFAPGVLLDGRALRRGTAAVVPARGCMAALGGAGGAPVAVLHAGPAPSLCFSARPTG